GRVNAEARLLAGEVQLERGNFDDAGKAFKGVALLYDDPAITPRALDKAAVAFRQAGNTEEADRLSHELRERYPNYAGGVAVVILIHRFGVLLASQARKFQIGFSDNGGTQLEERSEAPAGSLASSG